MKPISWGRKRVGRGALTCWVEKDEFKKILKEEDESKMYLEDQVTTLETARSIGAIDGFRPIRDGAEVEIEVKQGSKLIVRRHHTELVCPDGTTIRFNLGIRDAIDTILLRSGISLRVDSNVDPKAIIAKSEPPKVTLEIPAAPVRVKSVAEETVDGPAEQIECTCPDGWFPAAEATKLRKIPPGPGFAHHETCVMTRQRKS